MQELAQTTQSAHAIGSTVKVGILHSLSGTLAISEASLKDAALMAIAEINQAGGVLGRKIEPIVEDSASDPTLVAFKAKRLLQDSKVTTIFGCWSSTGRKLVLPLLEKFNVLLWYPVQYEGLERSDYVFYTGACPNQQVEPAVNWLLQNDRRRFYLLGMDYVFPRVSNKIIKAQLKRQGGMLVGEDYPPLGATDFRQIIASIKATKPDVVFSTLNGDSNIAFYQQYREAGISAAEIPVMAVSVAEDQLQDIGEAAVGHYATWSYFQSLDTAANQDFVQNFKAHYGSDRVTSDPIEAAYSQVYLWKQAVETAQSFETEHVRLAAYGQTFYAPSGLVRIERNHHLWKHCRIGEILPTGQFQTVYASNGLIKPQPWLGVDDIDFADAGLIVDMLAEVPQSIQYSCQLEQKSRELEATMAELLTANQRLQTAKDQLIELTDREELLKRRLSIQIRNSLELDTILNTAVHEIRNLLQIDRCHFFWCPAQSEPTVTRATAHTHAPDLLSQSDRLSDSQAAILTETVLKMSPLWVDDVATAPQLDTQGRECLASLGIVSLLAIAIHTHSGRVGAIVCEQTGSARPWSSSEVELLQDVADQLAIAIDQAELYAKSQAAATAAQLQAQQLEKALLELQQTQAQLIQTEKMSSLGQLVAGVAHEINNPVNFIYGNLSHVNAYTQDLLELINLYQQCYPNPTPLVEERVSEIDLPFLLEDLPKILSSMRVGTDRIRQIVLSLRNFSRLDEADMKPVNIHEGIDSTLLILQNRLKARAGHSGIEVIKDYGELPLVECYAGQLNQVFMNVLNNAIDALESYQTECADKQIDCPPSTITICTSLINSNSVLIQIADNGPGMPESVRQQLFNPFFTTKPVGQGTGLGLSISYQIVVEKHSGSLRCESQPGQGAKFQIEIPVVQGHS